MATLWVALWGQSIIQGNDGTFSLTGGSDIRLLDLDGNWTQNPTSGNNGSTYITPLYGGVHNTGGPHQTFGGYLAEALLALPDIDAVNVMAAGKSATSADDWAYSEATNTLCGYFLAMVDEMSTDPGFDWNNFMIWVDQGHADTTTEADGNGWITKHRAIRNAMRTYFARPNLLFGYSILPSPNPTPGPRPYWDNVIDGQTTIGDDDDCLAVKRPNGPFIDSPGIHPTEAAQRAHAADAAPIIKVRLLGGAQDLHGQNFRGANFRGASLTGSSLDSAQLPGADFKGAALGSVDFDAVSLTACNLSGATLTSATFASAVLPASYLSGHSYSGANLTGAKVTGKTF